MDVSYLEKNVKSKLKRSEIEEIESEEPDVPVKEVQLVKYLESNLDYQFIASVVEYILVQYMNDQPGSILIFLPGVAEISGCIDALSRVSGLIVLPLHAGLTMKEQSKVFEQYASKIKVICATNIAETSIAIDDVVYVIESGRVKGILHL